MHTIRTPRDRTRIILAALGAACCLAAVSHPTAIQAAAVQSAERTSYVLFSAGEGSVSMSGSTDDIERARAVRMGDEPLLYVRHGGASYVIRDAATLRRAHALFEPQRVLGERQAELGSRQAALGSRQAALGADQARLGARQANASARERGELGRQQGELGRRQSELGEQQSALGRRQAALGREQARLGREANAALQLLVADAIRSGTAHRLD